MTPKQKAVSFEWLMENVLPLLDVPARENIQKKLEEARETSNYHGKPLMILTRIMSILVGLI
jgi:hypothetical protein